MIRPDFAHSASAKKKPRTTPYIVLTLLLLVMLAFFFENEIRRLTQFGEGRKLLVQCIHNMYATSNQAAVDMPKPPAVTIEKETSSSMAICQEWIRRRAQNNIIPVYTQEDDTVCMDWTSPHYRVLEIVAASILDRLNDYSRYRHDCYRSRTWDEAVTGYDRTTVQQLLPVARMGPNHDLLNISEALTQCKVCLDNFDAVNEDRRVKTFAYHHCFAWPQEWEEHTWIAEVDSGGVYGDKIALPHNATKPNTVPLTSVFTQIRRRLQHAARTFANVTHAPPDERDSGVVIWLDAGTTGIPQDAYPYYFPDSPTSITVLSSPLCATALLPTGELCYEYAQGLVSYFQTLYPGLTNTGYGGLNGIQFQMSTSSAGSWSRMIRSKTLICPPTSPNCLLPASAKEYDLAVGIETQAYVLDIPSSGKAIEFFTLVGHWDRVVVERLSDMPVVRRALMRELVNISAPRTSTDEEAAPIFLEVNEDVNDEGYPPLHEPAPLITQSASAAMTDSSIYSGSSVEVPSTGKNENIYYPNFEKPVSGAAVDQAVAQGLPININYLQDREPNRRATEEMAVDGETSMTSRVYVANSHILELRKESQERIQLMKQEALHAEGLKSSPSTEMEIFCPLFSEGYAVNYDKGTVEITKNDEVIVSDGAGTAVFDKDTLNKQELLNDRYSDGDDEGKPYTEIYDPTARKMVRLNGADILINSEGDGIVRRDPTGVLFVDNTTTPLTATLVTEGATGNLDARRMGDMHKKYTGTIVQTGQNRVNKGDVVRHGRGYAVQDTPEIGTRRSIYGWWNGFYSSKSASSSESGGSGYQGTYTHHYRPSEAGSSSEEGGTSDSRDFGPKVEDREQVMEGGGAQVVRHLGEKVSIKVPVEEFRRFGERRVCQNNRDKVIEMQRRRQREMRESTKTVNIRGVPARRKLNA